MGFAITAVGDIDNKVYVDIALSGMGGRSVFDQFFPENTSTGQSVPQSAQRQDGYCMVRTNGVTGTAADALVLVDNKTFFTF